MTTKTSLKRIAPGCYETRDGKWVVVKTVHPHNNATWWYFRSTVIGHPDYEAHDLFYTKREAVASLAYAIAEGA